MNWHDYVRQHLAEITGDTARDEDIVDELAQHLVLRTQELRASGLSDDEAVERAARELRDAPQLAKRLRDADARRPMIPAPPPAVSARPLSGIWQDTRYAARLLRRHRGFAAAAIFTLALGIGFSTSIFAVVDAVLLRPIPFQDPDRLVMVWETDRDSSTSHEPASFPDYVDFRERTRQLIAVGAVMAGEVTLAPEQGEPTRLAALTTSASFLDTLGVQPMLGRRFTEAETQRGGPPTVLISEGLWTRLYGRAPDVIGRTVRLDGVLRTIIGVLPSTADFGILQVLRAADYARGFADRDARAAVDVWAPMQADATMFPRRTHPLFVIGRLGSAATVASAQDELTTIAADLERTYPENSARGVHVQLLGDVVFGKVRPALAALMGAVGLLLLLSCVNVANLLLTRGTARLREVAVRSALGADRRRLARQFVVENMLLTFVAAAGGLVLAQVALWAFAGLMPPDLPRASTIGIDLRLIAVPFGAAVLIGIAFGMLPVWQASRLELTSSLGGESARVAGGSNRVRSALVVAEIAFAVALTIGAGLLIKSFWRLQQVDPGFNTTGTLKAQFQLPRVRYPIDTRTWPPQFSEVRRFNDTLLERLFSLPGVQSAALAVNHPLDPGSITSFVIVGREEESRAFPEMSLRIVSPGYFETLGIPLLRGRMLEESDGARPVMMINEAVAERFFVDRDAVGQEIGMFGVRWQVVGVVGRERFHGVAMSAPIAAYVSLAQLPSLSGAHALVLRTAGDPAMHVSTVRAIVRELDPEIALFGIEPLRDTLAASLGGERFMMLLVGLFAALALVLAAIGIHGVLSYTVEQRTREMGIRLALGATAGSVLRSVVGQGARLVVAGGIAGSVIALMFSRVLARLLFGVSPADPMTIASVVAVLGAVAAAALWVPARRAVRIDPVHALRVD